MEWKRMTMAEVVGQNVRRIRLDRDLSQEDLRLRLEEQGVKLSRPTVAQLELGKRPTTVDELLALALALGVAPHLLLYPPRPPLVLDPDKGVKVGLADDTAISGFLLAGWIWDPDRHRSLNAADQSERRLLLEAMDAADRLSDEQVEQITESTLMTRQPEGDDAR